jgi:dihydropyrimidinase
VGLLVKGGEIVTAERRWRGDVRCRDGQIVEVGGVLEWGPGEELVDAGGLLIFPGGVDPHVHMELPVAGTVSSDDFETGTAAGLAGGTTTIIDFVHPERGQDFLEALQARKLEAAKSVTDYGLHMAVTWWGKDTPKWITACVQQEGIPSFKIYMAYLETVGLSDKDIARVLKTTAKVDGLVLVHAEEGRVVEDLREQYFNEGKIEPIYHARSRPPNTEGDASERIAEMARTAGANLYVVHVTCEPAVTAIAKARKTGQNLWAETCPQYLLLEESVYGLPNFRGAAYVIAPPIRPERHQAVLWRALSEGTLQVVATDHCPFNFKHQKELGRQDFRLIPGGAAGIENRLALLYSFGIGQGRIDLHRFVDLISTQPAKLFGLYPRKGAIEVGADADLVLWDPEATAKISARTHHHRCDRSIYEGFKVKGSPATVIANGRIRYHDGKLRVETGTGRFLERQPVGQQEA